MYGCRLGRWRWCFCGITVLFFTALYLLKNLPTLPELAELHTCPACFGTSLCPAVLSGAITLEDIGSVPGLVAALGAKNVFFGSYSGKHIVLKKLGHLWELEGLDRALCVAADLLPDCKIKEAIDYLSDIHSLIMDYVSQSTRNNAGVLSSFHLCPSADNLDLLLSNVINNNKNVSSDLTLVNIWTLLHLNAEPLILQILPAHQGWPVPKYFGACGRLVVEEFVGQTLSEFTNAPWPTRAHLAKQLLIAALHLTERHSAFRFYLTDVSLDNVAVDVTGNVKFIDLENTIIVDKQPSEKVKPATWNNLHVSENYDCKDCFAFSSDDICSHHISDHNFYAICQELLLGSSTDHGLLVDLPAAVLIRQPDIPTLLQQCAHSPGHRGRRSAAMRLISVLQSEASFVTASV